MGMAVTSVNFYTETCDRLLITMSYTKGKAGAFKTLSDLRQSFENIGNISSTVESSKSPGSSSFFRQSELCPPCYE